MATIRIRDWTKEQLEELREAESHSSHDSVIKSLLKDHELAQCVTYSVDSTTEEQSEPEDTAFEDLTVFDELVDPDNGVLFLWCPNCGNEMAHLTIERPVDIPVYEMECQRCLTRLDQHAIVGIEIGYPIEQRLGDGTLEDDLKGCVIDYWDRTLEQLAAEVVPDREPERIVWQFNQYLDRFDWQWPVDVPVIGVDVGNSYDDEVTGERLEVLECVVETRTELNTYRIKRTSDETGESTTELMGSETLMPFLLRRSLYLQTESTD